jgi:hypothetical protein
MPMLRNIKVTTTVTVHVEIDGETLRFASANPIDTTVSRTIIREQHGIIADAPLLVEDTSEAAREATVDQVHRAYAHQVEANV